MQVGKETSKWLKKYIIVSANFTYSCPHVTLEMRSRSPKYNHFLRLSKSYIYASLAKTHPLVQKISCVQDYDLEKKVKVTKNLTCLKPTTVIYSCRSGGYPSIGSKHISFLGEKLTFIKLTFDLDKG